MNIAARTVLLLLLSGITVLVWLKPAPAPTPAPVRISVPSAPDMNDGEAEQAGDMWRVVTRRVVSQSAIESLKARLESMQLEAIAIRSQEDVTMHAFDDATLYTTRAAAEKAADAWREHDFEVTIIEAQAGQFLIGLGRFYQGHYAEGMQKRLADSGREFRYQQRTVPIPAWRFTFTPMRKQQADSLWKQLNDSGVVMPVVMPETRFQELYGRESTKRE